MTDLPGPGLWPLLSLAVAGLWLVLACLTRMLSAPRWQKRSVRALILAGVPVLGWLTLAWGPGPGMAGLAVGLLALLLGRAAPQRGDAPLHRPAQPRVGAGQ